MNWTELAQVTDSCECINKTLSFSLQVLKLLYVFLMSLYRIPVHINEFGTAAVFLTSFIFSVFTSIVHDKSSCLYRTYCNDT